MGCSVFQSSVDLTLTPSHSLGRFTHTERRVVDGLKRKFLAINGVFYLCWLPNVLNGIILWTAWDHLPKSVILVVWYLMVGARLVAPSL